MIGIDIVYIPRIAKAIKNDAFRNKVFTPREQEYCEGKPRPQDSYAGLFAAKEAAAKAVKRGFGNGFLPINIEITHEECGAPVLTACGGAAIAFQDYNADVSISHDGDYAVATVMLTEKCGGGK